MRKTIVFLLIILGINASLAFCNGISTRGTPPPDTKKYYEVVKEGDKAYIVFLMDDNQQPVRKLEFPQEPFVRMVSNDIVEIKVSVGSPLNYTQYYDPKTNRVSVAYTNILLYGNGKIVFAKTGVLIVSDIFDENVFYKEIIRDFSRTAVPSSAFLEVKWVGNDNLVVRYLEGPPMVEKTETIEIDE